MQTSEVKAYPKVGPFTGSQVLMFWLSGTVSRGVIFSVPKRKYGNAGQLFWPLKRRCGEIPFYREYAAY